MKIKVELTLSSSVKQHPILSDGDIDLDETSMQKGVHDHGGDYDGHNPKFHKCSALKGENKTHPV